MSKIGITKFFNLEDGRKISIETGRLAKQADGSALVTMGDTMLLATVVANKEADQEVNFLPLSVDYKEKYASLGRFPGGFFKREARPSDYEVLISRLVDRALRPLFPDDFHAQIQVQIQLISGEENVAPDVLAALAASSAISVSDIPFNGPISEVRVAKINGEFIINPNISETEKADLNIIVASSMDNILMVEGEMKEVPETDIIEAIKVAHKAIKVQCKTQIELSEATGKTKREYCHENNDIELKETIEKSTYNKCYDVVASEIKDKQERTNAFDTIKENFIETLSDQDKDTKTDLVNRYFHDVEKNAVRKFVLKEKIRLDGRKPDEIRPIWCEVNPLPSAHGSAIFTRGETQALVTVTLGGKMSEQIVDGAVFQGKSKFLLHYNFPGFATGEVKPNRGVSRREIGHGNLALRALKNLLPKGTDNPYTIRIVSDILESNGSSSMATVCGGTLALMDAGIKIAKPVSGIAMGLIIDKETDDYTILSDILGDEDHLGDMDFKVTGTKDGITACQMDIKVDGLPYSVLYEALNQAREGRLHILAEMEQTISEPRKDYKPFAPRIIRIPIPKEFIGAVIGPGGKIIQGIQEETNTTITIDEENDLGIVEIISERKGLIDLAISKIKNIVAVPKIGEVYKGTVKNITTFGAFVEILPGKEGLLHISEIDWTRIKNVESVLKLGEKIEVKIIDIDKATGKMRLSRKVLLPKT
jgi:polyribonucleotide nucleotidyltransferase